MGFFLAVWLFSLLLFSLSCLSVTTAEQAFTTSLWLGHPLVGIWQVIFISPGSRESSSIPVAFLLWPLKWAIYGFLLERGRQRSEGIASMAAILLVAFGLILNSLTVYALLIAISPTTLRFAVILSGTGIALIYLGLKRST